MLGACGASFSAVCTLPGFVLARSALLMVDYAHREACVTKFGSGWGLTSAQIYVVQLMMVLQICWTTVGLHV